MRVMCGRGAIARLPEVLAGYGAERVLVVASRRRFRAARFPPGVDVELFDGFSPNPVLADVVRACAVRDERRPDVVVGLGGGSALDVAKCARLLPADLTAARAVLDGGAVEGRARAPLVLVPTTAGSGSEVTRFATLYDRGAKRSFDRARVRADVAIVDPDLLGSCPPELVGSCAFDALCHAVESLWSRRATAPSRGFARAALRGLVPLLAEGARVPDAAQRDVLARAALAAGRAIDLTRTTAAHAFAYRLTSAHGVPHGVACLLNLSWLLPYNIERAGVPEVVALLGATGRDPLDVVVGAFGRFGWSHRLRDYGVTRDDLPALVDAGLGVRARADNNPAPLERGEVLEGLRRVL
ncbi:phosphonoacetaldehyde reductase [Actinosynnema sp. NPDC020468]|uniref:phosphonoacetaldehyde reductase n=1 Tax=Actinosynnema sp. NPDC020468 TaxID=3154488 RepID=UPI0033DFE17C